MIDAWIYDALDELYMSRSLSPALQVCQRYRLLYPIQRDLQWVGTVGQLRYLWECLGEDGGSLKTFAKQFIRGNGQRFSYKANDRLELRGAATSAQSRCYMVYCRQCINALYPKCRCVLHVLPTYPSTTDSSFSP